MLDRKFILENAEAVAQNCVNRKVNVDIPRFVELETQRKAMQQEIETLNAQANATSKSIGKAKDAAERDALKEQGRQLRESVAAKTVELDALTAELDAIHRAIPNMSHPDAPIGEDDKSNLEVGRGATPVPTFDFP
ncbi:MAG: serine--tRNA ligase, partial [Thermoguttaceae bacterium]|nr:serine--tRNA ligase [Thermoguttaceae bacterium]